MTIARDDWGIAHVRGKTDADAVFGMIYAQAEDDFNRVETNYLTALGRTAEAEGETAIWADLRQKLFMQPAKLKAEYAASPAWLKRLMDAWADGLNYYLATHPDVHPRVINHFEPWMALCFTEGSIGGDIERIDLPKLQAFYGHPGRELALAEPRKEPEPGGSNGIAIAPSNTAIDHALLLINPHTSFFFRSELQMTSDEGLDAYGAATWGQFFLYQGFNPHIGWMHTSSGVDSVDEFAETIVHRNGRLFYRYGTQLAAGDAAADRRALPHRRRRAWRSRSFTIYRTHHGPIVRAEGGKWIAIALMNKPIPALEQSYLRTKARDLTRYLKVAGARGQFLEQHDLRRRQGRDRLSPSRSSSRAATTASTTPGRSTAAIRAPTGTGLMTLLRFAACDRTRRPAGSTTATTGPIRRLAPTAPSAPIIRATWTRPARPRAVSMPSALLGTRRKDFTIEPLRRGGLRFLISPPSRGWCRDWSRPATKRPGDPLKARLADQIALLRGWDDRWGVDSVPTSLAIFWGEALWKRAVGAGEYLPGCRNLRLHQTPRRQK